VSSLSQIQELLSGYCKWATSVTVGHLYTRITFTSLLVIRFNVVGVWWIFVVTSFRNLCPRTRVRWQWHEKQ